MVTSIAREMSLKLKEYSEEELPRERFQNQGARALSVVELLAILIRTGRAGASVVDLARELLRRFGSLEGVARASVSSLSTVPGIGATKAIQILAAFELGVRLQQAPFHRYAMENSEDVWKWFRSEMIQLNYESVRVMVLNSRREMIVVEEVTKGILNESLIHPREVYRHALTHQGFGIILAHNHPSGDPTPSVADHEMTRQILEAGKILGIPLLDHVIIGNSHLPQKSSHFSFHDAGYI